MSGAIFVGETLYDRLVIRVFHFMLTASDTSYKLTEYVLGHYKINAKEIRTSNA